MRFKQHSLQNNELFLLAAQYFATVILASTLNLEDSQIHQQRSAGEQREIFEQRLLEGMFPITSVIHKKPWWDVIDTSGDLSRSDLIQLSKESYDLMIPALRTQYASIVAEVSPERLDLAAGEWEIFQRTFSFEILANMLGMFDLNNHAIETESPLQKLYASIYNGPDPNKDQILSELKQAAEIYKEITGADDHHHHPQDGHDEDEDDDMEKDEEEHEEDEEDEMDDVQEPIFPRFEGIGLFLIASSCNHSCDPNCEVIFAENNTMSLIAKKEIKQGEQILHSYIEETQSVEGRAEDLKEYGFVCNCARCQQESA